LRNIKEMSFRSIECFSNDGKLDVDELNHLIEIAERDGEIDRNEVRVLRNIISRIRPEEVDASMQRRLEELAQKLDASSA
jgi:uncharacterized tellurite resistance protein B-like protein